MFYDRREDILAKIASRLSIIDNGYQIDGKSSPCHIWQGPTSGNGRGGGYAQHCIAFSLDEPEVRGSGHYITHEGIIYLQKQGLI